MKQNILLVAWSLSAAAAGVVALGASCTPQTECDYINRDVADPLHPTEDDIAYCWQGFDSVGLYTFRFERAATDGGTNPLFIVDPPNSLEPAGNEFTAAWELVPDLQTPAGPVAAINAPTAFGGAVRVQVNQTSMILGDPGTSATALRRAVCRGFGHETAAKQCRGSASRPE